MKNLIAVHTIKEVLGYEFNRSGRDCRVGCVIKKVGEDAMHEVQVLQSEGVRSFPHFKQIVHSDGTIHSICGDPNVNHEERTDGLLDNDYLYDNEFDVFIGAEVPVTIEKKRRIRVGRGRFMVKTIPVETIKKGYWYGKYRVVDTWIDKETGFKHYIQKPVSLSA